MDLATIFDDITAQGSMFWAATGSVALGGTLILVAAVAQVRRLRRRNHSPVESPAGPEDRKTLEKSPAMAAAPQRPASRENFSPVWNAAADPANASELRDLAARLRSAADKLENFRRNSLQEPSFAEKSPLKESRSRVDYVFRAGMG